MTDDAVKVQRKAALSVLFEQLGDRVTELCEEKHNSIFSSIECNNDASVEIKVKLSTEEGSFKAKIGFVSSFKVMESSSITVESSQEELGLHTDENSFATSKVADATQEVAENEGGSDVSE